jgi:hypothetical protein
MIHPGLSRWLLSVYTTANSSSSSRLVSIARKLTGGEGTEGHRRCDRRRPGAAAVGPGDHDRNDGANMAQTEADQRLRRPRGRKPDGLAGICETVVVRATGFPDYGADLMRSRLYELRRRRTWRPSAVGQPATGDPRKQVDEGGPSPGRAIQADRRNQEGHEQQLSANPVGLVDRTVEHRRSAGKLGTMRTRS